MSSCSSARSSTSGKQEALQKFTNTKTLKETLSRGEEPTPKLYRHFRGHRGSVNSVAFHPLLTVIISGGVDGNILYWNYENIEKRTLRFEGHEGPVNDVSFSPISGDLMISGSSDQTIKLWVPTIRGEVRSIKSHSGPVRSVCFNPTGNGQFLSASDDKTVKLWNVDYVRTNIRTSLRGGNFLGSWLNHTNWVRSVRYAPDGAKAISASDDCSVNLIDFREKDAVTKIKILKSRPIYAEFNPAAENYVGVATEEEVHIYDIRNKKLVQCYQDIHSDKINKFTFHASGDFAMTISEDKSMKILDIIEGRPIFTLFGAKEGLLAVSCNKDGSLLASAGKDKEIFLWEPVLLPYSPLDRTKEGLLETDEEESEDESDVDDDKETSSTDRTIEKSSVNSSFSKMSLTATEDELIEKMFGP